MELGHRSPILFESKLEKSKLNRVKSQRAKLHSTKGVNCNISDGWMEIYGNHSSIFLRGDFFLSLLFFEFIPTKEIEKIFLNVFF